jgi:hypothetical protein
MSVSIYIKDPNAILDYPYDWSPYLGVDTISTSAWTVPAGITSVSQSFTTTTTTIWLSGGSTAAPGPYYDLTNRITTAGGRTDERTFRIKVRER